MFKSQYLAETKLAWITILAGERNDSHPSIFYFILFLFYFFKFISNLWTKMLTIFTLSRDSRLSSILAKGDIILIYLHASWLIVPWYIHYNTHHFFWRIFHSQSSLSLLPFGKWSSSQSASNCNQIKWGWWNNPPKHHHSSY